jgi:hypothetical protein
MLAQLGAILAAVESVAEKNGVSVLERLPVWLSQP